MPVLSLVSNKKDVIPISYLNVQSNQAQKISLFAELPSGKVSRNQGKSINAETTELY